MSQILVDTDVLSAIMRRHPQAVASAQYYLSANKHLSVSLITRYEILRGLHAKQAVSQLAAFEKFCTTLEVLPVSEPVIHRAAEIYGELHRSGTLIGDADILIAATCLQHGYEIATNNQAHFSRVSGLVLHDWTN